MDDRMISADAHITKHPDTCVGSIDAACRDKAPKIVDGGDKGDVVVIEGMKRPTAMGLVAEVSEKQMAHPTREQKRGIVCNNVAGLYQINPDIRAAAA